MTVLVREVPEKIGMSSKVLLEMYEELEENFLPIHSLIIMRHGKIATSGYWYPYTKDMNHIIYSTSKSITALAVGFCIEEGRFTIDDRIIDFFPELITGPVTEYGRMRTVRHLLTMTDGQLGDPNKSLDRDYCDWLKSYLNAPPRVKPGTLYGYNNAATIALAALVQRVTGMTMMEYLQPRLFEPLGIHGIYCEQHRGIDAGSRGIHCKTEDLAKIGQLMLQKGQWEGKQIISARWVEEATKKHVEVTNFSIATDGNRGYGYQWWLFRDGFVGTQGNGGNNVFYNPKYDLVFAYTANMEDIYGHHPGLTHVLWPYICRSMTEAGEPDPEAYAALQEKESKLEFALPKGMDTRSPQEDYFSGKKYTVAPNEAQINDFVITKTPGGLEFVFSMYEDQALWKFEAGFNQFIPQYISVTDDEGWAKYIWRNEHVLELNILLKEKLGSYRFIFYCDNNEMSFDFFSIGWRDFKRITAQGMAVYHGQ